MKKVKIEAQLSILVLLTDIHFHWPVVHRAEGRRVRDFFGEHLARPEYVITFRYDKINTTPPTWRKTLESVDYFKHNLKASQKHAQFERSTSNAKTTKQYIQDAAAWHASGPFAPWA